MQRSCWFKVQSLRFKVQKRCRAFKVQGCPQRAAELLVQGSKFKKKQAADYKNFTQITQSSQIFLIKYKSFRTLDLCLLWNLCELLTANY